MQQAYVKASNPGAGYFFGSAVAISGETMVVGSQYEYCNATGINGNQTDASAKDAGAAYVFVRDGTNWVQQAYLKASNTGAGDQFGWSVAISGDTIVVGASTEDSAAVGVNGIQSSDSVTNSGAAYVFVREGTNWTQQAYLKPSNTRRLPNLFEGYWFGFSVGISGNTIVVGALDESSNGVGVNGNQDNTNLLYSGAAYVFVRTGTNWAQQAYLKASNPGYGDEFGYSIGISGNTIVVGARGEDSSATGINGNQNDNGAPGSGAAYVFVRNGTFWSQQAYLKASNTGAGDQFGSSVGVFRDTIVVGAYWESSGASGVNGNQTDDSTTNAGAAYVFVRNGATWSQQAYLKASNPNAQDKFGWRSAVSGDTIVIGARQEASNATGINGNQNDNSAPFSSAAYVFTRSETNWSQQAYLKASNTGANQAFGWAVAVAGSTVIVGAQTEGSNAAGVNGDQNNNLAGGAGAVYVFSGLGVGPRLAFGTNTQGRFIRFFGEPLTTYQLQRATSMGGPWDTMSTLTTPPSGLVQFQDPAPPPANAFYRTLQP